MAEKLTAARARNRAAELEAALHAIMRVTDPGDLRSREAREAWEAVTPARRIAREVLGLEIGGHATPPDAERRGDCTSCMHPAHWSRRCHCGCVDYTEA